MKFIWNLLLKTLQYSFNILNILRKTILNLCLLILIIIGIGCYYHLKNNKTISTPSALILDITGIVVDKPISHTTFQKISKYFLNINKTETQENSLFDITNIIRQSINDPNITGLILLLKNFSGGSQSSLEYIGKALSEFKKSGKPIYAFSDYYNQTQYLLASYANTIYLAPQGSVDLKGISSNKLYYKSFLKNLKINTHVFRVGSYKSAVEPFTRDNMSYQVRNEENKWINQLWNQYLKVISYNRNITEQQIFPGIDIILNELNEINGNTSEYAFQKKWVDKIASKSSVENTMKKIFGQNKSGTSFNTISMYDYNLKKPIIEYSNDQIAIIFVQGAIINGVNNMSESIGSDIIAHKIRTARFNPKIKALVIRVNSPGGSVHASELIRQEIISTRNSGKPVVISMGDIATSGAYWISSPANFIIASNSTLTGSIGVFGIINTFEDTLDAIGIHNDEVNTSPIANISTAKALPIEFKKMMQLYVNTSYQYFVKTVAKFRYKTIINVNQIAQGHIWSGNDALKHGLIDKIGDFDDAINKAAELANLKKYQLNWFEDKIKWTDILLQQTEKIIRYTILQLLNQYISSKNISMLIDNINYNNSQHYIWNDPKYCYALCLNYIY